MGTNIGFVSTRFAGTDDVTLESSKWAEVFEASEHACFWFAGELDRDMASSFPVPEAHFKHPQNRWINERIFGKKGRGTDVTELIHSLRSHLKVQLHQFIQAFDIEWISSSFVVKIIKQLFRRHYAVENFHLRIHKIWIVRIKPLIDDTPPKQ